uniref:uncharacterized protein LOC120337415 isoform X1 n=1 Tax=Styela clava TaxID=7725 RepID=UPI0019396927|nr:uncharacterized protein LOC120337415 isoform X1 [Styela clava]
MEYRPDDWWLNAMKNYSEQQWLSNFRTRKETFSMLTTLSRSELEPGVFVRHYRYTNELRLQYTNWDQPLNLGPQGTCLGYIEHLFTGMYISPIVEFTFMIACILIYPYLSRFCECLIKHRKQFIFLPTAAEAKTIAAANQQLTGFPQCFGAMDGSHIHIKPSRSGLRDYVNRKM